MAADSTRSTGDEGLAAQLDAVEEAAALLTSRHDECFSTELGFDFTTLPMRPYHESRPLWVTPTGRIFLEAYSDLYEQARDFLVAICEPKSRPQFIHEYGLDRHALFAAASMGMTGSMICEALDKFSKCEVADGVKAFVRACTSGYGKVKLVLHRSRFYIESPYTSLLKRVAANPVVHECRVMPSATSLAAARIDKDGFLIGEAKLEGSESVGLQGVIARTAGAAAATTAAAALRGVSRGGARMSMRVTGEVNEEDESSAADTPAPRTTSSSSSGIAMAPADAVPQATADMSQLADEDLLALVDEAEARWASTRVPLPEQPASAIPTPPNSAAQSRTGKRNRPSEIVGTTAATELPDSAQASDASSDWREPDSEARGTVLRFEIRGDKVDVVRAACAKMHPPLPLMLEYDFREDRIGVPTLAMELTRPEGLRPYQSRSLAKMFGNGRARSGMIVLPCGAGKTLVGIAAACTIKKSTIVLCPNETSINQWVEAFVQFASFGRSPDAVIRKLTASARQPLPPPSDAVILLTTYSMIGMRNSSNAAAETVARLREIESREWGLMLLDETHQVVANTFRRVLFLSAHCRLGLTATLVREDGRDRDLVELIGPKLYEANWMDLTRGGFLANVQVVEVWCPMTPAFLEAYLGAESMHRRSALAVMNPTKAWATSMLLHLHKQRPDDKVIVFSDSRFALERYAKAFDQPMIHGGTSMTEREAILAAFREDSAVNVLFLSKVGDVALDVPDANVIIQISSHYGSRMQEAQRMGRILRKKKTAKSTSRNHAFFYSLLSTDTEEVAWSLRRRRYLVDQGYAYKVLTAYPGLAPRGQLQDESKFLTSETEQETMLFDVLRSNIEAIDGKESKQVAQQAGASVFGAVDSVMGGRATQFSSSRASRGAASMAELSGGTGLRYVEYHADRDGALTRLELQPPAEAAAARAAEGLTVSLRVKPKSNSASDH